MNLVELQRENEALKLKLFWKEHSHEIMENAMRWANAAEGGPGCSCLECADSDRHVNLYGKVVELKPCTFKPWFEHILREHDMSIGRGLPDKPKWDVWFDGSVVNSNAQVLDDGQHFSILGKRDWSYWRYGSKLWKATSVRDPEIAKLERLLNWLNPLGEWV